MIPCIQLELVYTDFPFPISLALAQKKARSLLGNQVFHPRNFLSVFCYQSFFVMKYVDASIDMHSSNLGITHLSGRNIRLFHQLFDEKHVVQVHLFIIRKQTHTTTKTSADFDNLCCGSWALTIRLIVPFEYTFAGMTQGEDQSCLQKAI